MSNTHKREFYTKHKVKGRQNEYGLCCCAQCRSGRAKSKDRMVIKAKHRARTSWKSNKPIIKGIYTD